MFYFLRGTVIVVFVARLRARGIKWLSRGKNRKITFWPGRGLAEKGSRRFCEKTLGKGGARVATEVAHNLRGEVGLQSSAL